MFNYHSVWRKLMRRSCGKCGGSLVKTALGFWVCSRCGKVG